MTEVQKIVVPVEIWQAQNYWPIKGWSSPLSGCAHYTCQLTIGGGSENFPDDLSPPPGWEWSDKWGLDMSGKYGQPDPEGWFYASTFDRLGEMLKTAAGVGIASKTSLVRKRRWVRNMVCVAEEFCEAIRQRVDDISVMRRNIELTLKEKEQAVRSVKFYEENRSFVFSQSLHLGTQGTLNTLSLLKDIGTKLKSMKQYLQERAMIEREHASRMEAVAHKYWVANQDSPVKKSQQRQPFQSQTNALQTQEHAYPTTPAKPTANHSMNFLTPMSDGDALQPLDSYELFFGKVFATSQANSMWLQDFSNNLVMLVTTEIDQMLLEIQSVLKEARASFRKNSDICRLSEAAIRNFLSSVTIAYDSVSHASLREISDLSDELNGLRGGVAFAPATFAHVRVKGRAMMASSAAYSSSSSSSGALSAAGALNTAAGAAASTTVVPKRSSLVSGVDLVTGRSSSSSSAAAALAAANAAARDDIWLAVQRYKLAVRDSQEALCVLISESMDLELQHQIFANRVHYLFSGIVRSYCQEETQLYSTLHGLWNEMMKETTETITDVRVPFPIIQSPFAQLNLTLDDPSFFQPVSPVKEKTKKKKRKSKNSNVSDNKNDSNENNEQGERKEDTGSEGEDEEEEDDDEEEAEGEEAGGSVRFRQGTMTGIDSDDDVEVVRNNRKQLQLHAQAGRISPFSSPSKDDLANMAIGMGVFSFTFLYREPLPKAPGVVRSGNLLYTTASAFNKSKNILFDAIWKTVYLVATTDGYVHVLTRRKSDIPERSFYLKESLINDTTRDFQQDDQRLVFELTLSPYTAHNKSKAFFQEGLFFRCHSEDDCQAWLKDFQRLTLSSGHVDETVEEEVREAMLQSLPILKGETAKIDLELQKYEIMQQQYQQQQQQQQNLFAMNQQSNTNMNSNNNNNNNANSNDHSNNSNQNSEAASPSLLFADNNQQDQQQHHREKDEFALDLIDEDEIHQQQDDSSSSNSSSNHQSNENSDNETETDHDPATNHSNLDTASDTPTTTAHTTNATTATSKYSRTSGTNSRSTTSSNSSNNNSNSNKSSRRAVVAPPSHHLPGTSTTYQKNASSSSWKSSGSSMMPVPTVFGVAPVNTNLKPKQLIPKMDKNVPLARKHSTLIAQYEQALQKEKEKVEMRVTMTKDKRLQDVEDMIPEVLTPPRQSLPLPLSSADAPPFPPHSSSSSSDPHHIHSVDPTRESPSVAATEERQNYQNTHSVDPQDATAAGGGGGGGVLLLSSESLDIADDQQVHSHNSSSNNLSQLASMSMDSTANNHSSSSSTTATTAGAKKTRRLVKTLSQKFDVNAVYNGSNNINSANNNNDSSNNYNNSNNKT